MLLIVYYEDFWNCGCGGDFPNLFFMAKSPSYLAQQNQTIQSNKFPEKILCEVSWY